MAHIPGLYAWLRSPLLDLLTVDERNGTVHNRPRQLGPVIVGPSAGGSTPAGTTDLLSGCPALEHRGACPTCIEGLFLYGVKMVCGIDVIAQ